MLPDGSSPVRGRGQSRGCAGARVDGTLCISRPSGREVATASTNSGGRPEWSAATTDRPFARRDIGQTSNDEGRVRPNAPCGHSRTQLARTRRACYPELPRRYPMTSHGSRVLRAGSAGVAGLLVGLLTSGLAAGAAGVRPSRSGGGIQLSAAGGGRAIVRGRHHRAGGERGRSSSVRSLWRDPRGLASLGQPGRPAVRLPVPVPRRRVCGRLPRRSRAGSRGAARVQCRGTRPSRP